jgi:hypothetical protein
MIHTQKLVSAAYLAFLSLSYSASNAQITNQELVPGQVYTTPNIVQPTISGTNHTPWVNGVFQQNLTCWAWGDPGYCGPNAIVRPGNNVNFSFGLTDLYQSQSIAAALPNSGTGLTVNGFNFSFTAKNGNGWDDGRVDVLSAYVRFLDSTGKNVQNFNYNLNYKFNWTTFNYNETFTTPYATKDLGNVHYGFVGKDNNNWAGPYGPEVTSISFRLKYSVDPCHTDVLSSPSCPGYLDAVAKLNAPASYSISPTTVQTAVSEYSAPPSAPVTQQEVSTIVHSPTPVVSTQTVQQVASVAPTKVGEVVDTAKSTQPANASSTSGGGVSLSTILGIVSSEQSRISNVEKSVVQQAVEQAVKESEKTQRDAERLAEQTQQQSIASSNQSAQTQTSISTNIGIQSSTIQSGVQQQTTGLQGIGIAFFSPGMGSGSGLSASRQEQNNFIASTTSLSTVQPRAFQFAETETIRQELPRLGGSRSMLEEIGTNNPNISTAPASTSSDTVKKDVANNELAGGVDIALIAKQPPNFAQYSVGMPDSPFYAPKEIYRNQRTVDNARVLRGLMSGSDMLHQEMVDQQYKK